MFEVVDVLLGWSVVEAKEREYGGDAGKGKAGEER